MNAEEKMRRLETASGSRLKALGPLALGWLIH
jgi:hypothetical protein